jgi:sugar phosphate isomerase/epimerase
MIRRDFILQSSAFAAASFLSFPQHTNAKTLKNIGIQLYTLRSLMKDDYKEVLEQLGKLGYKEIETYPSGKGHFWGRTAKDFFSLAKENGLQVTSTHIPLGIPAQEAGKEIAALNWNFEPFVEAFAKEGGKYIVCPYVDNSLRNSISDFSKIAEALNKAGETCKKAGLTFAYHNHDFEFKTVEGTTLYAHLLKKCDASLVKMELDLYWAAKADQNIENLFKENPGRFPLVHVKDMGKVDKATVEVGNGSIDFVSIFKQAKLAGIQHYFVEQDNCPGNPLTSVEQSLNFLKKLNF